MVEPIRQMNWGVFILLLIFTLGIGAIIYLIYYLVKEGSCPMCNSQHWGIPPKKK
jgi:uncharacterized membrane protein